LLVLTSGIAGQTIAADSVLELLFRLHLFLQRLRGLPALESELTTTPLNVNVTTPTQHVRIGAPIEICVLRAGGAAVSSNPVIAAVRPRW
jgi:hypothetical protein